MSSLFGLNGSWCLQWFILTRFLKKKVRAFNSFSVFCFLGQSWYWSATDINLSRRLCRLPFTSFPIGSLFAIVDISLSCKDFPILLALSNSKEIADKVPGRLLLVLLLIAWKMLICKTRSFSTACTLWLLIFSFRKANSPSSNSAKAFLALLSLMCSLLSIRVFFAEIPKKRDPLSLSTRRPCSFSWEKTLVSLVSLVSSSGVIRVSSSSESRSSSLLLSNVCVSADVSTLLQTNISDKCGYLSCKKRIVSRSWKK